jgi:peptide deformylase
MKIVNYPHPSLRFPAKPVTSLDRTVRLQAGKMLELMYEANGLGLAAPQVALPIQLLVMNFAADAAQKDQEVVALNPVIVDRSGGTEEDREGCLSFPGLYQKVRRSKTVKVQYYNLDGVKLEMTAHGLAARVWQHEVDHLHGKLFIDVMGTLGKIASRSMLKDFEKTFRRQQERGEFPSDDEIKRQLETYKPPPPPPDEPEPPPAPPAGEHPPIM